MPSFAEVDAVIRAELGRRYSAAAVRIDAGGKPRFCRAYGAVTSAAGALPVFADTRFDIASLTKVFVTTVVLALVRGRRLELDATLTGIVPEWRAGPHAAITLRMLLAHSGGLRSGADYRTLFDRDVEAFARSEPLAAPPGSGVIYSDLGFIVLGTIVARATGRGLAAAVEPVLRSFGAAQAAYRPSAAERPHIPATERDAWRGLVAGQVHDEKAYLMNGVAGHAGLFAGVADVARLAEWYLGALAGRPSPLDPGLARCAVAEAAPDPVLRRGLGWALKTSDENSCGARMSPAAFGHTGFTGTAVWADPERDLAVVFLTNAVHFGRSDTRAIRSAVCDAACAALDAA